MARKRAPYAPEFRRQMIELVRAGRTPEELAKEFEQSAQAIRNWVAQADRDEGHLALNGKALRTIPVDARRGAYASFGGALRRPFGLAPFIIRHV